MLSRIWMLEVDRQLVLKKSAFPSLPPSSTSPCLAVFSQRYEKHHLLCVQYRHACKYHFLKKGGDTSIYRDCYTKHARSLSWALHLRKRNLNITFFYEMYVYDESRGHEERCFDYLYVKTGWNALAWKWSGFPLWGLVMPWWGWTEWVYKCDFIKYCAKKIQTRACIYKHTR